MQNVGGDACDERVSVLYKNKNNDSNIGNKEYELVPIVYFEESFLLCDNLKFYVLVSR